MLDYLYLTAFYIFRFAVKYIPQPILNFIFKYVALIAWSVDTKHRKIIRTNLNLAFEESMSDVKKTEIEKACYENMLFLAADFIKNQGISKQNLAQKVKFVNEDIVRRLSDKPIIFTTAHYSNWELGPLSVAAFLINNASVVGRPLDSKAIDGITRQNREQFNIELIEKTGAMKGLFRAIKNSRSVGILVDQNTTDSDGIIVDFFNKPVRHTPAASILARRFDLPIVPTFVSTDDWQTFTITFYQSIMPLKTDNMEDDILKLTQAQADITEQIIRQRPQEWFWFHKRWKNKFEDAYLSQN